MRALLWAMLFSQIGAACASKHFGIGAPASGLAADCVDASGRPDSIRVVPAYTSAELDSLPRLIQAPLQRVPAGMEGQRGRVELELVIDRQGAVVPCTIAVVAASDFAFIRPSVDMAKASRFRAGIRNGEPVQARVRQMINFR